MRVDRDFNGRNTPLRRIHVELTPVGLPQRLGPCPGQQTKPGAQFDKRVCARGVRQIARTRAKLKPGGHGWPVLDCVFINSTAHGSRRVVGGLGVLPPFGGMSSYRQEYRQIAEKSGYRLS